MALYREPNICPTCGKQIKALHKNMGEMFVGDTFIGYEDHKCVATSQEQGEVEDYQELAKKIFADYKPRITKAQKTPNNMFILGCEAGILYLQNKIKNHEQ